MIKLLIVDDETTTRKGLKDCIPWLDIGVDEVTDAEDGQKALEVATKFSPDIVLTDVRMPKMNGIELATKLRAMHHLCKIIFLSGYSDKEYLLSAIHLQAVNYVEKPVNLDEIRQVIQQAVQLIHQEREKLRIEKSNLCLELIKRGASHENIKRRLLDMGLLPSEEAWAACSLIKVGTTGQEGHSGLHEYKQSLFETIERHCTKNQLYDLCTFKDDNHILLIVFGNTYFIKKFQSTLMSIKEELSQWLEKGFHFSVGLGQTVHSLESIPDSYQGAVLALQNVFFEGYNHILTYQEQNSDCYDFSQQSIQPFVKAITTGCKNQANLFIKSIVSDVRHRPNTLINHIKNFFFNLLMTLSKLSEDRGIELLPLADKKEFFWEIISKAETLSEIEAYLLEKIDVYFKALEEKESRNSIVYSVMKYIQENYHQVNLSIKNLSDYAYLTPNYLCLLFKKEVGKTINQYITEIRMEKAKELLKNRKVKLYEVSNSVGFSDANYFAKLFKKMEGLNPSEYREKYFS